MKLLRIAGTTTVLVGIAALSLVGAAAAQAETVSPAQVDHTYSIEMQLMNTSSEPLTLDSVADNDGAHWQQRAPQTLPADMTSPVDVTAYSEDPSGFLTTVTYTTPSGDAIVFQAVNYFGEQDSEGLTVSHDPSVVVEFCTGQGAHMDATYVVTPV